MKSTAAYGGLRRWLRALLPSTIITCNSCKTVSTYSMALATVNIDKIIKVASVVIFYRT